MITTDPEPEPESITLYVVILLFLILLSAFFSSTETAFTSANRVRLKTRANDGKRNASKVLELLENFDRVLFTLLIGNNIVNITASTIGTILFVELLPNESLGATVSTIVLTVTVLIFGEIFPKLIAKEYPERLAELTYPLIKFFSIILFPICMIFAGLKWIFEKVFKFKGDDGITEEELLTMVEEANEDGTIEDSESELISSAIEFHDCEVGDILVPRVNVIAVPIDQDMAKIKKTFFKNAFSRLPVYSGTIDKIVGMIHERDFLIAMDRGETSIQSIIKKTAIATEHMKISTLLRNMQKAKVHLAVVVDEYGGTLGIVTLEDILEELVGEIWDEHDEIVEYFDRVNENTYRVDGNADLGDFFELFSINTEEDDFDSQTVGGWVMEMLGELPKKNDSFDFEHLHVILTKCTQRRVMEVKVVITSEEVVKELNEENELNY